jgi:hypothetical protein
MLKVILHPYIRLIHLSSHLSTHSLMHVCVHRLSTHPSLHPFHSSNILWSGYCVPLWACALLFLAASDIYLGENIRFPTPKSLWLYISVTIYLYYICNTYILCSMVVQFILIYTQNNDSTSFSMSKHICMYSLVFFYGKQSQKSPILLVEMDEMHGSFVPCFLTSI